jgi:hypothetical protein
MQLLRERLTLWTSDDHIPDELERPFDEYAGSSAKVPALVPLRAAPPVEPPHISRAGPGLTVVHDFIGFCQTHQAPPEEVRYL